MYDLSRKEHPAFYWVSKVGDFCGLSVLWLLLCVPLVTIAPSCIAMYDSVAHCIQGNEEGPFKRFFRTFKNELLKGMLISVMWLAIGFLLVWGYNILYQLGKNNQIIAIYSLVHLVSMVIPLGVFIWVIPVQSRFKHTFFGLHKSAAVYAISHLPTTAMVLALLVAAGVLVFFLPVLVLLVPGITVTLQSWFIERVFKLYIPEEDTAEDTDD